MWALSTGAGKDSTLALHRARSEGLDVGIGINVYEGSSERVRFHGTRKEMVGAHCRTVGLELLQDHTHPGGFESVFVGLLRTLADRGVEGLVFGNIHLPGVREWYEERVTAAGLLYREPLWGEDPADVVREFLDLGFRATVVSVDLEQGEAGWVGRELTRELVEEVEARGGDPCGEQGEYHTYAWDGPGFGGPVPFRKGEELEIEGHRLLDLLPAD